MYTPVTLIFSQTQPSCIVFGLEPRQVYQDFVVFPLLFIHYSFIILKLQMLHNKSTCISKNIGGGRWYTFVTPENLPNLKKKKKNVGINLNHITFFVSNVLVMM